MSSPYPPDGYPDFLEAQWKVEKLNLPRECYNALKRTGIEYIGDVLDFGKRIVSGGSIGTLRMDGACYSIILRALLSIESCPMREEFESWLHRRED